MTHVKKLVMNGFKSFARKTEIVFDQQMNLIVGPNGSGKSNVMDALCFVLGRLSIKSIRAAKAANLMFSGSKAHKPSHEASVELVFDNADKTFSTPSDELSIKRIVRRNGQSIYKINNETKTRQELIELLTQAGIDPHGFNLVLQGEIAALIKMNSDERRKIIEEVAGISIYESRKQKSIKEMDKTDEKLKEVSAVLREKNTYLRNLERERQEALNFKKLEQTIKRCKATIILKNLKENESEIEKTNKLVKEQEDVIGKIKKNIQEKRDLISNIENKLSNVSKSIQESTGDEQETLHKELSELKAEVAGLTVRKENFEARIEENKEKIHNLREKIHSSEEELKNAKQASPKVKKQEEDQSQVQNSLDELEKKRRRFYIVKSELSTLENKKEERQKFLIESKKEVEMIERNITSLFSEIKYAKSNEIVEKIRQDTRVSIETLRESIDKGELKILELEKSNAVLSQNINRENKLRGDIPKLDICPLCQSKITEGHVKHVIFESNRKLKSFEEKHGQNEKNIEETKSSINQLKSNLGKLESKLNEIEIDMVKLSSSNEKKNQIKKISQEQNQSRSALQEIESKISQLRKHFEQLKNIEEQYDETRLRLQELSFVDLDMDTDVAVKQKEINRQKMELKSLTRDSEETEEELKKILQDLDENESLVEEKENQEKELYERAQKLFEEKNHLQDQEKAVETDILGLQHEIRSHEERINQLNIKKAEINARIDSLKEELEEFKAIEPIPGTFEQIKEKLDRSQSRLSQIGNVNMRALEIYDKVKEQVGLIEERVQVIEQEKEKIQKIIQEIDKKKRKSFNTTLDKVNELFTRNFSQLSKKGQVFLDLENKKEPFEGGLNIILKVARGKYFDVSSLSGGEKTLVALSLIFAIQEYNPYCFYIFDEIDAALDKHNSERLAALVKKHMTSGQYIIITHNDALISEASTLYGVSMQENISKVISLKV
jgi:chromosome segregation protein